MLSITESALNHLSSILKDAKKDRSSKDLLRLTETSDGLALVAGEQRKGDEVYEHNGSPILALEPRVAEALGDQTLQVNVEDGKTKLALTPTAS